MKEDRKPIFDALDPADLELSCFTDSSFERDIRAFVRIRYGGEKHITADELPDIRGHTKVRGNYSASPELLIVSRMLRLARKSANERKILAAERTLRHSQADTLEQIQRFLLNAEVPEEFREFDLGLFSMGGQIRIAIRRQ